MLFSPRVFATDGLLVADTTHPSPTAPPSLTREGHQIRRFQQWIDYKVFFGKPLYIPSVEGLWTPFAFPCEVKAKEFACKFFQQNTMCSAWDTRSGG